MPGDALVVGTPLEGEIVLVPYVQARYAILR